MEDVQLRKVGGSVMLSVPPAILKELALEPGQSVGLSVTADGALLVNPKPRKKLSLRQLLAEEKKNKQSKRMEQRVKRLRSLGHIVNYGLA